MSGPSSWREVPGPERARLRRLWQSRLPWPCRRCGLDIVPGQRWDLGHPPGAGVAEGGSVRSRGLEPEHSSCNRSAGARLRNLRRAAVDTVRGRRPGW